MLPGRKSNIGDLYITSTPPAPAFFAGGIAHDSVGVVHVTDAAPAPTVLFDFAVTKTLDPRITFTRASVATYFDVNGVMQTAGVDVPRFSYDPVTHASLGLLIEEARTNLALNSAVGVTQNVTVTAGANTLSFYGTGTIILSGAATGTLVGTGANNRVFLTFTPAAGALTLTVSGSVTKLQLEVGPFPTSYIATAGAAVLRAADIAVVTGTNFSTWYNPVEGTIQSEYVLGYDVSAPRIYTIQASAQTESIRYRYAAAGDTNDNAVIVGNVTQASLVLSVQLATNTKYKNAMAYKQNDFARSADGATPVTDLVGTLPVVDRMYIGQHSGGEYLNGHAAKLAYYNTRLSNSMLQSLSTTTEGKFANGFGVLDNGALKIAMGGAIHSYQQGLPFTADGSLVTQLTQPVVATDTYVGELRVGTLGVYVTTAAPVGTDAWSDGFSGGFGNGP